MCLGSLGAKPPAMPAPPPPAPPPPVDETPVEAQFQAGGMSAASKAAEKEAPGRGGVSSLRIPAPETDLASAGTAPQGDSTRVGGGF